MGLGGMGGRRIIGSMKDTEVQLWRASLARDDAAERLAGLLSADEVARAERFLRDRDRARFIVARATLRRILGACLGVAPAAVRFVYGPYGKPALAPEYASALQFSLAHSGDWALYAVARGRRVGVDVEGLSGARDELAIARRFFAADEIERLTALEGAARRQAFVTLWTVKEAYAKALGGPLVVGLRGATVRLDAGPVPVLQIVDPGTSRWSLRLVEPAPGYLGAVVAEGRDWTLTTGPA